MVKKIIVLALAAIMLVSSVIVAVSQAAAL